MIHLFGDYDAILQVGQSHNFELLKPITLVSGKGYGAPGVMCLRYSHYQTSG